MNDKSSPGAPVRADLHFHSSASEPAVPAAGEPRALPQCTLALAARMLQGPGFNHADLERRARRIHERKLTAAASRVTDGSPADLTTAAFSASLPALPYIPAAAFLARERAKLAQSDEEPRRVAVIADGLSSSRGIAATLDQLRERGLPGYELVVIGTDAAVDRRLAAVTETEAPFYPGVALGVPSLFAVAEALTDRRYDLIHICTPGPAGIAAQLIGQLMGLPMVASHHTGLKAHTRGSRFEQPLGAMLRSFYGRCGLVLSPSAAADRALLHLGAPTERIWRWGRGVDPAQFNPARYSPDALPDGFNVLYAGRLSRDKGVDLLAEAFLIARDRDPRLRLVLAGEGPEEQLLRRRLGTSAIFLGWLDADRLASVYASADLLVFPSAIDTFGQVILEAQASGLPVLAVDAGGSAELIESGRSGCLVTGEPGALASAIRGLARRETLRDRLSTGGLMAVRERSWERCMHQLAGAYARAIAARHEPAVVARAA